MQFATKALLAVCAWFGVLLQLILSVGAAHANGKSTVAGVLIYLGYFTVLTNIFVAVIAILPWSAGRHASARGQVSRSIVGCATAAILLVGLAYHLLLRETWSPQGLNRLANLDLHYIVPVAALAAWASAPGARLPAWSPLAWSVYPTAYLVYALVRGELISSYPYPFIDAAALGYDRVMVNAFGLLGVFVGLGYLVWAVSLSADRRVRPG